MQQPIQISVDAVTGRELVAIRADEPIPPGSLLKMALLYMAFEALSDGTLQVDEYIRVSNRALTVGGSCLGLEGMDTLLVWEAIAGITVVSSNDASIVLGERLAGSMDAMIGRLRLMGRRLGLSATTFHTVTGLNRNGQFSTARDMLILTRALMLDHPRHRHFLSMHGFVFRGRLRQPINSLIGVYPGLDGIKSGTGVGSGWHLAASARRDGHHVAAVTIGCRDRYHRNKVMTDLLDRSFAILRRGHPVPAAAWTALDVTAATGRKWLRQPHADWQATGVSRGAAFADGQMMFTGDFGMSDQAIKPLRPRIAALICGRTEPETADLPVLQVDDPLRALYAMCRHVRDRFPGSVLGVTGSAGKTSTVAMIRAVLADCGLSVHLNIGNTTNYVAQSIASTPPWADVLLLELAYDLRRSTLLSQLHCAVVTTVAEAHLSHVASFDELIARKAAIFNGLISGGSAIVNRDMPGFESIAAAARKRGRLITFGAHSDSGVRLVDYNNADSIVSARVFGREIRYRVGMPGRHMAANSLAALAVAIVLGLDPDAAAAVFARLRSLSGRGARFTLDLGKGSFVVIDETYNANPASMRAALALLRTTQPAGGRRVAVLGDMLEVGPSSAELHSGLLDDVVASKAECVYLVGPEMRHLWDVLPNSLCRMHVDSAEKLTHALIEELQLGDVVMAKASHDTNIHGVIQDLRKAAATRRTMSR